MEFAGAVKQGPNPVPHQIKHCHSGLLLVAISAADLDMKRPLAHTSLPARNFLVSLGLIQTPLIL